MNVANAPHWTRYRRTANITSQPRTTPSSRIPIWLMSAKASALWGETQGSPKPIVRKAFPLPDSAGFPLMGDARLAQGIALDTSQTSSAESINVYVYVHV